MASDFNVIEKPDGKLAVLGQDNNYIEFPIPNATEVLNKEYNGNLNCYFLFQNNLKEAIKSSKRANQLVDFSNNIPKIWEKTPESIKNKYKLLSKEIEKLNKPSELII